jgi:hypothetical protein
MSDKQDLQLGKIIKASTPAKRDAIHIAVAPVVAAAPLYPGTHVGLNEIGEATTKTGNKYIGVVDPFLGNPVKTGERFWLYLYPNTITSLRMTGVTLRSNLLLRPFRHGLILSLNRRRGCVRLPTRWVSATTG